MNPDKIVYNLKVLVNNISKQKSKLFQQLSDLDKKEQDLLHIIELKGDELNKEKFFRGLLSVRKERREIKNQMRILDSIRNTTENTVDRAEEKIKECFEEEPNYNFRLLNAEQIDNLLDN